MYSESAGRFLISVDPKHRAWLEGHFAGQPLTLLGEVRPDQTFSVRRGGRVLLETTLDRLRQAWTRRFGGLR
jgi:phosphoribosylformylglycinamidine synthase